MAAESTCKGPDRRATWSSDPAGHFALVIAAADPPTALPDAKKNVPDGARSAYGMTMSRKSSLILATVSLAEHPVPAFIFNCEQY